MTTNFIAVTAVGLISVVWVELIRDFYHALSHQWKPLYRLHVWHHRVFLSLTLSAVSTAIYRQAHWYNDVPESLAMLAFSFLPWSQFIFGSLNKQGLAWAGSVILSFLLSAIARGTGLAYADELSRLTHLHRLNLFP